MNNSELVISVGELLGIPRVTLRGKMKPWYDRAVIGALSAFSEHSARSVVLDLTYLECDGPDGIVTVIRILRTSVPGTCLHVVAAAPVVSILQQANLGPGVKMYSSTDEIAERLLPEQEILTSRWIARGNEDEELPLAA
ncbi:MAG: hypothetical protein ACUVRS_03670 [Armatimonadota bacterium]